MFDLGRFIADCRAARAQDATHKAMREVVARAVAEPGAVLKGIGEPEKAGIATLHHDDALTILNVVWAPYMTVAPHDHLMWAVIGVYTGREDNIFWRRAENGAPIEAAGARALCVRDAVPLGGDIVHSVTNPIPRLTGAIHVYGGDFFCAGRSQWDPESLSQGEYDAQKTMRHFAESNARWRAGAALSG